MRRVRDRLVDGPTSLGARFRDQRQALFDGLFPDLAEMTVLDLGGRAETWRRAGSRPRHVVLVNLEPSDQEDEEWVEHIDGDVCDLPAGARRRYDLVYSNSVLEHVGGHRPRRAFANTVDASAERYWIQTPYRYFPIEPHWLFPGMQFLPTTARATIASKWPLAHSHPPREDAIEEVLNTDLVSKTELEELFPAGEVVFERVLGLPKSLIAFRN